VIPIRIGPDVAESFPDVELGVVQLRGVDNRVAPAALDQAKSAAVADVRRRVDDPVTEHPAIAAWREAYRVFGTNPKKRRPTLEAIVRRVLAGKGLPSVSAVVDAYLVVELEQLVPLGGYDAGEIEGEIVLRRSPGGEPFVGLGETEASETKPEEVVYADVCRVLTRHWNYRDCDAAKITEASTNVVLVCEVLPWDGAPAARTVCERVAELVTEVCGGTAEIATVPAAR
jgi:DNA/RNA-binding domain of Phe-tRNA-synthetase-like protein